MVDKTKSLLEVDAPADPFASQIYSRKPSDPSTTLRYENLARWAVEQWKQRHDDAPYIILWASENCGNNLARQRVKPGRKLKGKARYKGYELLDCPFVVSISDYRLPGRNAVLAETVGAFLFSFTGEDDSFDVIYISSHYRDDDTSVIAIAILPQDRLETWAAFEGQCNNAVRYLERRQDVFIIGGTNAFFKPTIDWEDVILPDEIKCDLRDDMEAFFADGVDIYRQ